MKHSQNLTRLCATLLSAVLLLALLGGCASPSPSANGAGDEYKDTIGNPSDNPSETPSETVNPSQQATSELGLLNKDVLTVAMEIGYPPFELYDGNTPIGFDVDLAAEIAKILGVTVEYQDTAWDGIFDGLDINKYDCVISAVTMSAKRRETMDFSNQYIENWQSIVVKKGTAPVTSMAGLNGLKVGYQAATTSDDYLAAMIETGDVTCETSEFDKVLNCFDDLRLGRLDAVLCDSLVADGYISREPENFEITWLQSSEEGAESEVFGVAVKKGNQKLADAVNDALKQLEENGTIAQLKLKWF